MSAAIGLLAGAIESVTSKRPDLAGPGLSGKLAEAGIDSMSVIAILVSLENAAGIPIALIQDDIPPLRDFRDLLAVAEKLLASGMGPADPAAANAATLPRKDSP